MALSFQETGKYTSERHELARQTGKLTAGEAAKLLKKKHNIVATAKDLVAACSILGRHVEWHHSGFYKKNGKSTMGRTFFFNQDDVDFLIENWAKVGAKKAEQDLEKQKLATTVYGFYWAWDYDYGGRYGKKRNFKRLAWYAGSALNVPKNFTPTSEDFYIANVGQARHYFGWDEPKLADFEVS